MGYDKYYDDLLRYITENGETGVNVLAKELDIPLSTMQRYLERQTYFKKTVNRKWDIPNNVDADIKTTTMTLMVTSVETALMLLDSQMTEIQSSIQNALMPVSTLKRAVIGITAPVADKSVDIDKRLIEADETVKTFFTILKRKKSDIPEKYHNLLFNLDYLGLILAEGYKATGNVVNEDIYPLLAGSTDTLSDNAIDLLSEYQKGA